jgi:hypothetical protein
MERSEYTEILLSAHFCKPKTAPRKEEREKGREGGREGREEEGRKGKGDKEGRGGKESVAWRYTPVIPVLKRLRA